MRDRISTEKDFLEYIKEGTEVHAITSYVDHIREVDTFTVTRIGKISEIMPVERGDDDCTWTWYKRLPWNKRLSYPHNTVGVVTDLVNIYHGVFLNKEDAKDYIAKVRAKEIPYPAEVSK